MNYQDLHHALSTIEKAGLARKEISVVTGSTLMFGAYLDRFGVQRAGDNPARPAFVNMFGGVGVRENNLVPANRAILMINGEVVQILNLDPPSAV